MIQRQSDSYVRTICHVVVMNESESHSWWKWMTWMKNDNVHGRRKIDHLNHVIFHQNSLISLTNDKSPLTYALAPISGPSIPSWPSQTATKSCFHGCWRAIFGHKSAMLTISSYRIVGRVTQYFHFVIFYEYTLMIKHFIHTLCGFQFSEMVVDNIWSWSKRFIMFYMKIVLIIDLSKSQTKY